MKKFDVVVFDLDSTLVKIEGLDWLANFKGKGSEVTSLTKQAMEGKLEVSEAFEKRMKIVAPSYDELITLGEKYCESIVEGAQQTIEILHKLGKEVWIITGGFQPAVGKVAAKLGIPGERIFGNTVFFDKNGNYQNFDNKSPMTKNGGKRQVIEDIIKSGGKTVYIGDGVTDLEVKGTVDLFIGFGGVAERERVRNNADIYVRNCDLCSLLEFILSQNELQQAKSALTKC